MTLRTGVAVVVALTACVAPVGASPAGAAGVTQTAPVPVSCSVTLGHVPFTEVLAPTVTVPAVVVPGGTLQLRGLAVPGLAIPPNGTGGVTFSVVAGATSTVVSRPDFEPFDLDVPVTAATGTVVDIRLLGYVTTQPIPELGITFFRTCSTQGRGTFARTSVGGASCAAAAGSANLSRGLLDLEGLPQTLSASVRATSCTAAESSTVRIGMQIRRIAGITCGQGVPTAGTLGTGRLRWLDRPTTGGVSHVTFTAYGTGLRDLLDVSGVVIDGPHTGESVGMTVALTAKAPCDGVTPLRRFSARAVGVIVV
jgi:hypothetical protein